MHILPSLPPPPSLLLGTVAKGVVVTKDVLKHDNIQTLFPSPSSFTFSVTRCCRGTAAKGVVVATKDVLNGSSMTILYVSSNSLSLPFPLHRPCVTSYCS